MRRLGLGAQVVLGEDLALIVPTEMKVSIGPVLGLKLGQPEPDSAIGHQKCLGCVNWWIVWETARGGGGAQMAGTNCREKRNRER